MAWGNSISAVISAVSVLLISDLVPACAADPIDPGIAEAVFRYQFENNASGQQSAAHVYCIGFGSSADEEHDPPAEFIARFAGHEPPVKGRSGCRIDRRHESAVIDKQTGREGLIFTIGSVTCSSDAACEAEGGYYEANMSSSGNTYYLEKRDGKWVVVRDVMHWIS